MKTEVSYLENFCSSVVPQDLLSVSVFISQCYHVIAWYRDSVIKNTD